MPIIEKETGQRNFMFMGESSGALRVAALPPHIPNAPIECCSALHLYGKDSPTLTERAKAGRILSHAQSPSSSERDDRVHLHARQSPAHPIARFGGDGRLRAAFGDSVPTGTYLDMTASCRSSRPNW